MHLGTSDLCIEAVGLSRDYRVRVTDETHRGRWWAPVRVIPALQGLDLAVEHGEFLGLIGPNGAGKTTTIRLLAGVIHPSGGKLQVMGYHPADRRPEFLRRLALIMGNHSQLWSELPAEDVFELNREIYRVPASVYSERLATLVDLLDLSRIMRTPVRQLSLGQRMRCELAAGLLHGPDLLLLDEPTLGLDVLAQRAVREFLKEYNCQTGATVILTSHNMSDIKSLCGRLVLLHSGRVLYDGKTSNFVRENAQSRQLRVSPGPDTDLDAIVSALRETEPESMAAVRGGGRRGPNPL